MLLDILDNFDDFIQVEIKRSEKETAQKISEKNQQIIQKWGLEIKEYAKKFTKYFDIEYNDKKQTLKIYDGTNCLASISVKKDYKVNGHPEDPFADLTCYINIEVQFSDSPIKSFYDKPREAMEEVAKYLSKILVNRHIQKI